MPSIFQSTRDRPGLQRPDLYLAELHHACTILKCNGPAGKLAVLYVGCLGAVQDDGKLRALGGDLKGVPLVAGLGHRIDLGEIDDRPSAITWVRASIEDVDLIGIGRGDLLRFGAADEDTAVGGGIDPELNPQLKVGVRILRHQKGATLTDLLVGLHDAVRNCPVGVAQVAPIVEALAVEQRDPPTGSLTGYFVRLPKNSESN